MIVKTISYTLLAFTFFAISCSTPADEQSSDSKEAPAARLNIKGTFTYDNGNLSGNGQLAIMQIDNNHARFGLEVIGAGEAPNMGFLQDTLELQSNGTQGQYLTNEYGASCLLKFKINKNQIEIITEKGDAAACGFGNGVMADGTYTKNSDQVSFETY